MAARASILSREIAEIPAVAASQIADGLDGYREVGECLRRLAPRFIVTCARGSSDHAATYLKYVVETRIGVPVASMGPSVASIYEAPLVLDGGACITISQSGRSPDLARFQRRARTGGAETFAITNMPDSPVGTGANVLVPMLAGRETAVAASKSFVASLIAVAGIVAGWTGDEALLGGLARTPDALREALACSWADALPALGAAASLYVIGRGPGLAAAGEAALKLKETCRLHAEAYSAAEVRHGPIALARSHPRDRFAALVFHSEGPESEEPRVGLRGAPRERRPGIHCGLLRRDPIPPAGRRRGTSVAGSSHSDHELLSLRGDAVGGARGRPRPSGASREGHRDDVGRPMTLSPPDSRRARVVQAIEPAATVVAAAFPSPRTRPFPARLDTPLSRFQ